MIEKYRNTHSRRFSEGSYSRRRLQILKANIKQTFIQTRRWISDRVTRGDVPSWRRGTVTRTINDDLAEFALTNIYIIQRVGRNGDHGLFQIQNRHIHCGTHVSHKGVHKNLQLHRYTMPTRHWRHLIGALAPKRELFGIKGTETGTLQSTNLTNVLWALLSVNQSFGKVTHRGVEFIDVSAIIEQLEIQSRNTGFGRLRKISQTRHFHDFLVRTNIHTFARSRDGPHRSARDGKTSTSKFDAQGGESSTRCDGLLIGKVSMSYKSQSSPSNWFASSTPCSEITTSYIVYDTWFGVYDGKDWQWSCAFASALLSDSIMTWF